VNGNPLDGTPCQEKGIRHKDEAKGEPDGPPVLLEIEFLPADGLDLEVIGFFIPCLFGFGQFNVIFLLFRHMYPPCFVVDCASATFFVAEAVQCP